MAQVAPTPDPKARNRKRVRLLVWIVAVLIVLGLGAGGTVWWVLGQYYVGATEDNHVAIFEGVRGGPVLGIPLHRVAEASCLDPKQAPNCDSLTLDELQESAREDVRKGVIPEKPGVDGAREAVRRLWLGALLPACTDTSATSTSTTTTTTTSATGTSTSGAPTSGATTTSSTPTLTSAPQQPGKNCRKVG